MLISWGGTGFGRYNHAAAARAHLWFRQWPFHPIAGELMLWSIKILFLYLKIYPGLFKVRFCGNVMSSKCLTCWRQLFEQLQFGEIEWCWQRRIFITSPVSNMSGKQTLNNIQLQLPAYYSIFGYSYCNTSERSTPSRTGSDISPCCYFWFYITTNVYADGRFETDNSTKVCEVVFGSALIKLLGIWFVLK